jgi:hypothetical protein
MRIPASCTTDLREPGSEEIVIAVLRRTLGFVLQIVTYLPFDRPFHPSGRAGGFRFPPEADRGSVRIRIALNPWALPSIENR